MSYIHVLFTGPIYKSYIQVLYTSTIYYKYVLQVRTKYKALLRAQDSKLFQGRYLETLWPEV
jgi:hypothetical protein